jgi:hypothetical protein
MADLSNWLDGFRQSAAQALQRFEAYVPSLLLAILLMLVGWFAAWLLRALFLRLAGALNRILGRVRRSRGRTSLHLPARLIALIGTTVFWITILLFGASAARIARLDTFSAGLDRLVAFLPTLVAGSLIVLAGYLLSSLVRDFVTTALRSVGTTQHELLGFAAQGAVFMTAVVIGLDQIGIDVTFLIILVAVLLGGLALGVAFAFGFGARDFVANLIAAHEARKAFEAGESARIGDTEGRVLEFTPTAIVLVTDRGRVLVPAKVFQEQAVLITSDADDE